jgi:PAS domain S-box-containing protein
MPSKIRERGRQFSAVLAIRAVSLMVHLNLETLAWLMGLRRAIGPKEGDSGDISVTEKATLREILREAPGAAGRIGLEIETHPENLAEKNEYLRTVTEEMIKMAQSLEAMNTKLERTRDYLDNLIQNSADMIVSTGRRRIVTLFNRRAEAVLGYEAREVVGRPVDMLFQQGEVERVEENLKRASDGTLMEHDIWLKNKKGVAIPARLTASLIYDREGRVTGSFGACTDLTQIKALEEELMKQQKLLAVAELGGAASHELNQPLTVALGRIQLIRRREGKQGSFEQDLVHVERELQKMAEMIRRIGQITRYETTDYVGSVRIIDLKGASAPTSEGKDKQKHNVIRG